MHVCCACAANAKKGVFLIILLQVIRIGSLMISLVKRWAVKHDFLLLQEPLIIEGMAILASDGVNIE